MNYEDTLMLGLIFEGSEKVGSCLRGGIKSDVTAKQIEDFVTLLQTLHPKKIVGWQLAPYDGKLWRKKK